MLEVTDAALWFEILAHATDKELSRSAYRGFSLKSASEAASAHGYAAGMQSITLTHDIDAVFRLEWQYLCCQSTLARSSPKTLL